MAGRGRERAANPVPLSLAKVATKTADRPPRAAHTAPSAGQRDGGERLLFPVGHHVGAQHRVESNEIVEQVRRGATFHDLTSSQHAVWTLAHGSPEAIQNDVPWTRQAVEELAKVAGLVAVTEVVDQLMETGLLVEVVPGTEQALDFAKTHRVVPLMLGLGNTADEPWLFGIGFLGQPILQVIHPIYDLWQWSAMDDTLWATCQSAVDVARRARSTDPERTDPSKLLTGFLGSIHALLLAKAACLDIGFRIGAPPILDNGRED